MKHIFLAAALSSALLISTAYAAPNSFFKDLSGSWSGSGQAYVTKYGDISANCRLAVTGAETQVAMNGSCGMLVFSQALELTIKMPVATDMLAPIPDQRPAPQSLKEPFRMTDWL